MNNKRHSCHSGSSKDFRNSVLETQDKDQINFFLYDGHILRFSVDINIWETLLNPVQSLGPMNSSFIMCLAFFPLTSFPFIPVANILSTTRFLCIHLANLFKKFIEYLLLYPSGSFIHWNREIKIVLRSLHCSGWMTE